ncbi:MAG TPA: hypothetical protein VFL10_00120 [Ornithinibacter sp.]|nr:hypothetical protein [Ornithinibacter sp.]
MGNEEVPLGAGGGTTASGVTATGPAPGAKAHDSGTVTTGRSSSDADDGVLARVRSTFAGATSRRTLGWVLLAAWVAWLVALWVAQPRLVPQEFLTGELVQGRPTSFSVVTVEQDRGGAFTPYRLDVSSVSDEDRAAALDGTYSGPPVTVAYWIDAPVGRLRVVDPNGLSSDVPAALVQDLTAAGVPEAPPGTLWLDPPAQRTYDAGALLLLVSTLVVILGPRPRRGTRWFWFWVVGGPLSIGVALFAVAELIRPRHEPAGTVHPRGVAGRWNGLTGFAAGFVLSVAGTGLTIALTNLSPVWFLHT